MKAMGCRNKKNQNLDLFGFELTEDEMEKISLLDRGEKHDWY